MELYAYRAIFDKQGNILPEGSEGDFPTTNFNYFMEAFTTVFVVLTQDGWSKTYYAYYRTAGGVGATIFFISLIVIGQKILLNLFIAILLDNFNMDSVKEEIKLDKKKSFIEKSKYA